MHACNSDRVIKFAHSEKSELYLQRQRKEGLPGSLEKKLDDEVTADQCYFFSSVLPLIFGSLERNWSMLVPLHSFSGFLMLFVPSLCLPSAGNGNLYWTLLSVEARMLRRGMLVAVVNCWEELLKTALPLLGRRLLLVLPLQLREGVVEEHPSSLLQWTKWKIKNAGT